MEWNLRVELGRLAVDCSHLSVSPFYRTLKRRLLFLLLRYFLLLLVLYNREFRVQAEEGARLDSGCLLLSHWCSCNTFGRSFLDIYHGVSTIKNSVYSSTSEAPPPSDHTFTPILVPGRKTDYGQQKNASSQLSLSHHSSVESSVIRQFPPTSCLL